MTRAITLAALTSFLLAGAAISAILGRDSVPAAPSQVAEVSPNAAPVANRASKQDKLAVVSLAAAGYEPPQAAQPLAAPSALLLRAQAAIPGPPDTIRQAYASAEPTDVVTPKAFEQVTAPADTGQPNTAEPKAAEPTAATESKAVEPKTAEPKTAESKATESKAAEKTTEPEALPKPKVAAKPAPQQNYTLLSDAQIAGIKQRLRLTSDQEYYWPAVETALRAVARKIHSKRPGDPASATMPIDPDSEEVQQLKSAAMPLLFQLREDQKTEVRSLARMIGLERVAAMI
ncbi:hypothetical protein AS156_29950 [Bradyrhizobium macuxiense]|uniref:Uncharacterized protein n=1 Tax=Bradyrhizobium macuxiense TaxID=1755647 RepID=A0A120FRI5_9BRAD|nr:hypothetical protein [Bradyrhizobium macuxiense]KWV60167.1 hypothetical protein AS156_29950 [Bradyrhizobium macuxiense]